MSVVLHLAPNSESLPINAGYVSCCLQGPRWTYAILNFTECALRLVLFSFCNDIILNKLFTSYLKVVVTKYLKMWKYSQTNSQVFTI